MRRRRRYGIMTEPPLPEIFNERKRSQIKERNDICIGKKKDVL